MKGNVHLCYILPGCHSRKRMYILFWKVRLLSHYEENVEHNDISNCIIYALD
jgi:hypothetical protein